MEYQELILDMLNRIVKLEKEVQLLKWEKERKTLGECLDSRNYVDDLHIEPEFVEESEAQLPYAILGRERIARRDKTRYMFNGNVYLKNKLVLAIVKDYVAKNQTITCNQLKTIFDKSLQGSIGVVEYENIAKQRNDYRVRFFEKEDEVVRLVDGNMLVCSQWGILNVPNFIKRAEQLGYQIEQVVRE